MKLIEIVHAMDAVMDLYKNTALCARESYGVMKLSRAMRDDAEFYHEKRNGLLKAYGTQDTENKTVYRITGDERMGEFTKALADLDATEVKLQCDSVKLRGDIPGVTPKMLDALESLVEIVD